MQSLSKRLVVSNRNTQSFVDVRRLFEGWIRIYYLLTYWALKTIMVSHCPIDHFTRSFRLKLTIHSKPDIEILLLTWDFRFKALRSGASDFRIQAEQNVWWQFTTQVGISKISEQMGQRRDWSKARSSACRSLSLEKGASIQISSSSSCSRAASIVQQQLQSPFLLPRKKAPNSILYALGCPARARKGYHDRSF